MTLMIKQSLLNCSRKLGFANKIVYFIDDNMALEFLNKTDVQLFLFLSNINMDLK